MVRVTWLRLPPRVCLLHLLVGVAHEMTEASDVALCRFDRGIRGAHLTVPAHLDKILTVDVGHQVNDHRVAGNVHGDLVISDPSLPVNRNRQQTRG